MDAIQIGLPLVLLSLSMAIGVIIGGLIVMVRYRRAESEWTKLEAEYLRELLDNDNRIGVLEANVENWGLVIESLKARAEILKSRMEEDDWDRLNDDMIYHKHWSGEIKNEWSLSEREPKLKGCSYCRSGPGQECEIDCGYPSLAASRV